MSPFLKKLLTWTGVVILVIFIATRPESAADVFKSIGGGLVDIARGFGDFFSALVA